MPCRRGAAWLHCRMGWTPASGSATGLASPGALSGRLRPHAVSGALFPLIKGHFQEAASPGPLVAQVPAVCPAMR
jgi:hypothetical protein